MNLFTLYDSLSNYDVLLNPRYVMRAEPCGCITHVWVEGRSRHYQFGVDLAAFAKMCNAASAPELPKELRSELVEWGKLDKALADLAPPE